MSNFQVIKLWWISCLHPCKDGPQQAVLWNDWHNWHNWHNSNVERDFTWLCITHLPNLRSIFLISPKYNPRLSTFVWVAIVEDYPRYINWAWGLLHLGTISQWFFSPFTDAHPRPCTPSTSGRPPCACGRPPRRTATPRRGAGRWGTLRICWTPMTSRWRWGTWQRSLADWGFLGVSPQNSRWWWFEVEPTCFLFGFFP